MIISKPPPSSIERYGVESDDIWIRELTFGEQGSFNAFSEHLIIARVHDPVSQRLSGQTTFKLATPSALVKAPWEGLAFAWEGEFHATTIQISRRFVGLALGGDIGPTTIMSRDVAQDRVPDHRDEIVGHLIAAMTAEIEAENPVGPVFLQTLATALVHQVTEQSGLVCQNVRRHGGLPPRQLKLVLEMIDANLATKLSLLELSGLLGIGTRYFCRSFRISTGISPHQFIIRRRIERARRLIERGGISLTEVALTVGFSDHSQMSAAFRKVLNTPPSHFSTAKGHEGNSIRKRS